MTTFAFIGGGNMGRALLGGLIAGGHPAAAIRVADPDAASRARCAEEYGVAVFDDNQAACADTEVIVLAVKPQQMQAVASSLAATPKAARLYISIAAGITLAHLERWLGDGRAIVRCMPNTPALVARGASALIANSATSSAQCGVATQLLDTVGSVHWLDDEALMDAVTALSGSGPAYFFLFIELLQRVGQELGLPETLALNLARETALGAASLATTSDDTPARLRENVTSPGGTTERALASFSADGLEDVFRRALTAARDRSIELARQVDS